MEGNLPSVLYHYCSVETFYNIIKNKTIRLSDISKSNDYLELQWASIAAKAILDKTYTNTLKQGYSSEMCLELYNECDKFLSILIPTPFVCCFSQERDVLSQWRGYASDGAGLAIGFNPSCLIDDTNLFWMKVEYSKDVMYENFTNTFEEIFSELIFSIETAEQRLWRATAYLMGLRNTFPFYKNAAFYEEKEYRLIYGHGLPLGIFIHDTPIADIDFQSWIQTDHTECTLTQIQYHPKGNKLVPFLELSFENIKDDFIQEVIIGPKCDMEDYDIKAFLKVNNYNLRGGNILVSKSESSYK